MEISSSVYDYVMFDMNQEIKPIEHQMDTTGEAQNAKSGSELNWRGYDNQSLGSSMSDFISMYENQQHQLTIGTDSMNQSLDWLVSDATKVNDMSMFLSDFETLWSFNGVLSASESKNRVTNSGQELKSKSLKRNSDFKHNYNENPTKLKKPRSQKHQNTNFNRDLSSRPVDLEVQKRKRENIMISRDPQTVAARKRREKISERIRVLQRMIPGGTNMDTASVLEEAANYLRFLRAQVKAFDNSGPNLTKP